MDDESYFTVDGNEWQQKSYYESEDHSAIEDVKFIRKTKFPAKVLLWLAVSESDLSSKRCKVLDGKDQKRAEVHLNYGNS
jgi:hypothetical protein